MSKMALLRASAICPRTCPSLVSTCRSSAVWRSGLRRNCASCARAMRRRVALARVASTLAARSQEGSPVGAARPPGRPKAFAPQPKEGTPVGRGPGPCAQSACANLLLVHRGERQAQRGLVWVGAKKWRAGHEGHAFFNRAPGQRVAVGLPAIGPGQARPDEQAARGGHEFDGRADLAAQRVDHGLGAPGVDLAHPGQRGRHAAGRKVAGRRGLGEGAGVRVAELFAHRGFGQQFGHGQHPTQAQAGREHLAQAAAMHQQRAAAGHGGRQAQQAGRWRGIEIQLAIGVVFDDQGLVPDGHLQHLPAARKAERGAAGVAEGGDQVHELGPVLGDELFQRPGVDAVGVCRRADQIGAVQAKALDGGQEGGAFDDDFVAGVDQRLAQQVQRLLAAGGDDQVLGADVQGGLAGHEGGQLLAQRLVALGGAVLQGRAGVLLQRLLAGRAYALDVEQGAVRKAAGQADDAGLAQQFEKLADGGGFYVVQAGVEQEFEKLGDGGGLYVVQAVGKWHGAGKAVAKDCPLSPIGLSPGRLVANEPHENSRTARALLLESESACRRAAQEQAMTAAVQQDIDARTHLTSTNQFELLLFRLGTDNALGKSELFGINVFKIREIVAMPGITPIAGTAAHALGVVNLRGQVIPVFDLPAIVGCKPQTGLNIMLVTEYARTTQAFAVESVEDIARLDSKQVLSAQTSGAAGKLVTSIARLDGNTDESRLAQVLDVEAILQMVSPSDDHQVTAEKVAAKLALNPGAIILAADDSFVARSLIEQELKVLQAPYEILKSGQAAWDRLNAIAQSAKAEGKTVLDRVAMVLTDLEMPEMDGFTLTRNIKQDARFDGLPVVIHSSLSGSANEDHVRSVGANGYVAKFAAEDLAETIRRVLPQPGNP